MLPLAFYQRPTERVARDMLGKILAVRRGNAMTKVRIIETEAYLGSNDLACHSSKERTVRTELMLRPPGVSYAYLIYGMYHCFNVVTGNGHAVLIRAAKDISGELTNLTLDGPGKLCRALGLNLADNTQSLLGPSLWLEDAPRGATHRARTSRRRRLRQRVSREALASWDQGSPRRQQPEVTAAPSTYLACSVGIHVSWRCRYFPPPRLTNRPRVSG